MGFFSVGYVLSGLYASARALEQTYRQIRATASTAGLEDRMMRFDEFNQLIGVEERSVGKQGVGHGVSAAAVRHSSSKNSPE